MAETTRERPKARFDGVFSRLMCEVCEERVRRRAGDRRTMSEQKQAQPSGERQTPREQQMRVREILQAETSRFGIPPAVAARQVDALIEHGLLPSSPEPTGGEAPDARGPRDLMSALEASLAHLKAPDSEPAPAPTGGREARELWVAEDRERYHARQVADDEETVRHCIARRDPERWEVRRFREVLSETDTPEGGDDAR